MSTRRRVRTARTHPLTHPESPPPLVAVWSKTSPPPFHGGAVSVVPHVRFHLGFLPAETWDPIFGLPFGLKTALRQRFCSVNEKESEASHGSRFWVCFVCFVAFLCFSFRFLLWAGSVFLCPSFRLFGLLLRFLLRVCGFACFFGLLAF